MGSVCMVQDWETERRGPRGPAKSLLRIAEQLILCEYMSKSHRSVVKVS
jgi:hypothetical protein